MTPIEKILEFIIEVEKLKGVLRKTKPVGFERYENSAEHSWHVCITALMLKDYANEEVDINRVIKMLLIHDLCEIDAGDTIVYSSATPEIKKKEEEGIQRVLGILPEHLSSEFYDLWSEFELGETTDSVYAKSIDRVPPILHNLYGDGHSWKDNDIKLEQIMSVNSRIAKGSTKLWSIIKSKIESAVRGGILDK